MSELQVKVLLNFYDTLLENLNDFFHLQNKTSFFKEKFL